MNIEGFIKDCKLISLFAKDYKKIEKLKKEFLKASTTVVHKSFGTESTLSSRGTFCPSLIESIVIKNGKKGRIIKNAANAYYIYGFDKKNKLKTISSPDVNEFILTRENCDVGVAFTYELGLCYITESVYDSDRKLKSYAIYTFHNNCVLSCDKEIYHYYDNSLKVNWYRFYNIKKPTLEHITYEFGFEKAKGLSKLKYIGHTSQGHTGHTGDGSVC